MSQKSYCLTLESIDNDKITALFIKAKEDIEKSKPLSVCLDLSRLTVLTSFEIRSIGQLIQSVLGIKSVLFIFTPNSVVENTLKLVSFNRCAILLKDAKEYKSACDGEYDLSKVKEVLAKRSIPSSTENKKAPSPILGIIGFIIIALALAISIVFSLNQYKTVSTLSQDIVEIRLLMETQIDSLTLEIENCKSEYNLFLELESNQ